MAVRKIVQFIAIFTLLVPNPSIGLGQEQASTQTDPNGSARMTNIGRLSCASDKPVPKQVVLRLLDSESKPVAGAKVGTNVSVRDVQVLDSKLEWYPYSGGHRVSDESGTVLLKEAEVFLEWWPPERKAALYILHEERQIGAVIEVSRDDARHEIPVTLVPVCHVHGRLSSKGLDKIGQPLEYAHVYFGPNMVLSHTSWRKCFEFFVPPGTYELVAYGYGKDANTKHIERVIKVRPGISELDVGIIDLPLSKISSLIGKPAPEIGPIKEWDNGEPVQLADLRGKVVVLHFGGQHPSTSRDLPRLVQLHKLFADKGLVIIALYNVESMFQLMQKLHETSAKYGGVADVPFRLAVDGGEGRYVKDIYVPGVTHATYDIQFYPTTVLIDQQGCVRGRLNLSKAKEIVQEMLSAESVELDIPNWRKRFEQVYRLEQGQILKRIAPPFIPERGDYFVNSEPILAERYPDGPASMVFHWDKHLNLWGNTYHGCLKLGDIIEYVLELSNVGYERRRCSEDIEHMLELNSPDPEGSEKLLCTKLPGD